MKCFAVKAQRKSYRLILLLTSVIFRETVPLNVHTYPKIHKVGTLQPVSCNFGPLVARKLELRIPAERCALSGTVLNSKSQQHEVCMVGCLAHTEFSLDRPPSQPFNQHFCLLTKPLDEVRIPTVFWIRIRSDPKLFAGSGSVMINFGSESDELVLASICKLSQIIDNYKAYQLCNFQIDSIKNKAWPIQNA